MICFSLSIFQNMSQYNQQPIYVSSNSNPSLNQQHQQHPNTSGPNLYLNGPIYVSSNVAATPGLPNSASNNSVLSSQQSTVSNVPIPPPTPIYGQTNGLASGPINNGFANAQSQAPTTQYAPAPIPPQMPPMAFANTSQPAAPPLPPAVQSTNGGNVPPPPPPPPGGLMNANTMDMSSLAAQLQQAKLKRNAKANAAQPAENSGSSTSSGGSGNYGTIGRSSTGMASMMDEMAKTLARRRAQAEKKPDVS